MESKTRNSAYEISDPRFDANYRFDTAEKAQAKGDEIGSSRYTEVTSEGERTNFVKHEGEWKSEAVVIAAQAAAMEARLEAQQSAERATPIPEQEVIPEDWNKEPRYVQDPSMTPRSITEAEAAKEDRKEADMAKISEADLAAYDELEARQAAAAEIIPEDWNKEPRYVQDPSMTPRSITEAEAAKEDRKEADMAKISEADLAAYDELEARQAAAAEIIPEDWDKDADPFGPPLEGGMTVEELEATDAAINAEQQAQAIPEDWNKEPTAEAIPEDWNKEPSAEVIPEDWNKEPTAEIIPEDWNKEAQAINSIEPAEEREQVVIDDATRERLAKQRAEDRQAAEEALGHKSSEYRENQVRQDEIFTPADEPKKPILPPEVEREYVAVGTKYYSAKNPELEAFEDKGNKLQTKSDNEQVASNLVKIAEARGWDSIKVSGTETFRREVWLEAAARGMNVKGYVPSEQDKAALAARERTAKANTVEKDTAQEKDKANFRARENKQQSENEKRAEAFKSEGREAVLKKYPELAGAYAAQAAMQKRIESDGLTKQQAEYANKQIRERLAKSIERGTIPEVQQRKEVTVKQEAQRHEERDISR